MYNVIHSRKNAFNIYKSAIKIVAWILTAEYLQIFVLFFYVMHFEKIYRSHV